MFGSYVDGAGGSWLSFLALKFCCSCLFLSSGFIRSGSIPPGVLFSFPFSYLQSCVCPLLPRVSASSFPLFPLVRTTDNPGLRISRDEVSFILFWG